MASGIDKTQFQYDPRFEALRNQEKANSYASHLFIISIIFGLLIGIFIGTIIALIKVAPKYKKIMKLYGYNVEEIAAIGDQIYTDIKGANKLNITSILVNPLSPRESLFTKINRLKENKLFKKLSKQKILTKGEYYE